MTLTMQNAARLTLTEMQEFLEGSRAVQWTVCGREAIYEFLRRVLEAQQYGRLRKAEKGIVRRFLLRLSGLSRAQLTRLLGQWRRRGRITVRPVRRHRFPCRYTRQDIALLAAVDTAHEGLSGPAVRRIGQREYRVFGKPELPPALRLCHRRDHRARPAEAPLPARRLPHALRETALVTPLGAVPEARCDRRAARCARHPAQRYRGRPADAAGQSHTADPLPEAAPPENSLAAGGTRPISGELKQGKRAAAPLPRTPIPRYTQRQKKGASQQE